MIIKTDWSNVEKHLKAIWNDLNPPDNTHTEIYRAGPSGNYYRENPANYPIKSELIKLLQCYVLYNQLSKEELAQKWGIKTQSVATVCRQIPMSSIDLLTRRLAQLGWSFDMRVRQEETGKLGEFRFEVVPLEGVSDLSP